MKGRISRFISVDNPTYEAYAEKYQAKTPISKALYIFAYLLPGMVAYLLVNIEPVHRFLSSSLGLEGYNFQYYMFAIFTLLWHMIFPIFMLRKLYSHTVYICLTAMVFSQTDVVCNKTLQAKDGYQF